MMINTDPNRINKNPDSSGSCLSSQAWNSEPKETQNNVASLLIWVMYIYFWYVGVEKYLINKTKNQIIV